MHIPSKDINELKKMANDMRINAVKMGYGAGKNGAHFGGGLSCIEIMAVLYGSIARLNQANPQWDDRDRILVSKAHAVLAYYTALYEIGYLTQDDLFTFEKKNTNLVGHPQKKLEKGIEYAGGSLGMALSVSCGMALHAKQINSQRRIFCILGDGECEEGSVWEAALFAANYKLNNLVAIVDCNKLQYDGTTEEIAGLTQIGKKFECFGWRCLEVDGHDIAKLMSALSEHGTECPTVIIADTVKGKGVSFMENNPLWHHGSLSKEQYELAINELCNGVGHANN